MDMMLGGIFSLLGVLFLGVVTIVKKYYNEMYNKCTCSTTGIVDGVSEHFSNKDISEVRSYYPVYKYIVNGNEYFCKGVIGTYNPNSIEKRNIIVNYNPNNPSEAYVERKSIDRIIKLFKFLGIMFLSIGVVLIVLHFILK